MKTIALIEYCHGGHHVTYLRYFSKALLELGYRLMVFSSNSEEISQWIIDNCPAHIQQLHIFAILEEGRYIFPLIGEKLPVPLVVLQRWFYAAAIIREASTKIGIFPNLVFFNSIDGYFSRYLTHRIIDAVFPYSWSGLSLQAGLELLRERSLTVLATHHWSVAQSPRCHAIALLDRETGQRLQAKIQKPVVTFPDFTDESPPDSRYAVVQQIQEQARERKIVGLIGSLSKRKGLLTLLEAAQQSEDFFFVFAGQLIESSFSNIELAKITNAQASSSNCFFYFERIPDEPQFNALVEGCNILFAAYESFPNSSNILTKAAVFKKPIIVSEGFCMAKRVEQFNLGLAIPEGSAKACLQALRHLADSISSDNYESQFGFETYELLHSSQRLSETLSQFIEDQLKASDTSEQGIMANSV